MSLESFHNNATPAPVESIDTEKLRDKEKIVAEIKNILTFRLNVADISNSEAIIDNLFNDLVTDVEDLTSHYALAHSDIVNKQDQEDKALEEIGLSNVPFVLDKIQDVRKILVDEIPAITKNKIEEIITPPDAGYEIKPGDGSGFDKERELIPRLKMLLFILLNDCHQGKENIHVTEGMVTKEMLRKEPYVAVDVPQLSRLIVVCDEEGNRTDIFDTSHEQYSIESTEGILALTKEEKSAYGKQYPGSHISVRYSDMWSDRVYQYITETLPINEVKEKQEIARPATFEIYKRADESGFYTDEEGRRWGSLSKLSEEIGGSEGLRKHKEFVKILQTLPMQKVLFVKRNIDAWDVEEVRKAVLNHPTLSAYLRKTDESGFYTDLDGKKWGSIMKINEVLFGDLGLRRRKSFLDLTQTLPKIKILDTSQTVDAYEIDTLKEALTKDPELSTYFRKTNEAGTYTDSQGKEWISLGKIFEMIGMRLYHNKDFVSFIRTLPSLKVLHGPHPVDAYDRDVVKEAILAHPTFKKYLN